MTSQTASRVRGVAALIRAPALLAGSSGSAHAEAVPRLTPAHSGVLTTRATQVSGEIGEEVSSNAGDTDLIVRNAASAPVTPQHVTVAASLKVMSLALPAGTYTVHWPTVAPAMSGRWVTGCRSGW